MQSDVDSVSQSTDGKTVRKQLRRGVRLLTSTDHTVLGRLYLVFGIAAGLWGATDAMLLRAGLVTPGSDVWTPETFSGLFTTHGLTMLFFFAAPVIFGIAIYFIPPLVGADDLAFPRLTAAAFWLLPVALLLTRAGLLANLVGFEALSPPMTGWTFYVPMSTNMTNPDLDLVLIGILLNAISTILAAINVLVTVFTERAETVTWATLDSFTWSMLTTSGLVLLAFPVLCAASVMLLLDRNFDTSFFVPGGGGGGPLLWQHLFWFFGHPEVYILVLPPMGLLSLIIPRFSGRKLFGFSSVVYSTLAIGVLSFGVWAHHMFATGIDPRIRASFMAISLAIAVPSAVKTFDWIATMWGGAVRLTAPMLFCIGAIGTFVIGGVTGVFLAAIPVDLLYHGTYYVVGHFHLILVGTIVFALFAACYYWFPILTGKMYNTQLAKYHFWLSAVGVVVTFNLFLVIGMLGLPRRMATYPPQFTLLHQFATVGAFLIGFAQVIWLWNMYRSVRHGPAIETADVWDLAETESLTREWRWFRTRRESTTQQNQHNE
ncbi:cbb3-type cytochrome c oxidase subunit I [Halococcus sp. AFM35]|uniref:cbb3-type cytochrome c oxidase subunit I n=1 Tax=Halococcus sp. AFM35 TaxID=3421653 RepID=UPI003EBB838E